MCPRRQICHGHGIKTRKLCKRLSKSKLNKVADEKFKTTVVGRLERGGEGWELRQDEVAGRETAMHTDRDRWCERDIWVRIERDGTREMGQEERGESWTEEAYGCRADGCSGMTERTAGVRMPKRGKVEGCDLRQTPA